MGREIKRVPLTFNWPKDTIWGGYINPYYKQSTKCVHCDGGSSPEYKRLEALWYSHQGGGFKPEDRGSTPYLPSDPLVVSIIKRKIEWSIELDKRDGKSERSNYYLIQGYGDVEK